MLKETLDWDIAITLIDTAGIRDGSEVGKVEEIGIEFSKQSAEDKKHIKIANKADLTNNREENILYLSTLTKEGLNTLKDKIKQIAYNFSVEDTEFVTNNRQQGCLIKCKDSMTNALEAAKINQLQDLISIDLKSALLYLDEITGEVITDEILNNIFDHFCIGK